MDVAHLTLTEFAKSEYRMASPSISTAALGLLVTSARHCERANGPLVVGNLHIDHLRRLAVHSSANLKHSGQTTRNHIANVRTLWFGAHVLDQSIKEPPCHRLLPRIQVEKSAPTAWAEDEVKRLATACVNAPERRGWTGWHWLALTELVFETSLRIGCVIRSQVGQLGSDRPTFRVPASEQKSGVETIQPIRHSTWVGLRNLDRPDGERRVFPWPYRNDYLWTRFRDDVLKPAKLPCGRRDLFHKLRRTSYTYVYRQFGLAAAMRHAAHSQDLSHVYLDRSLLPESNVLEALPALHVG